LASGVQTRDALLPEPAAPPTRIVRRAHATARSGSAADHRRRVDERRARMLGGVQGRRARLAHGVEAPRRSTL